IAVLTALITFLVAQNFEIQSDRLTGVFTFGVIAVWRYVWLFTNTIRSAWYLNITFPKIRKAAEALDRDCWRPKLIHIILPTYRERPEVIRQVFQHLCREIQ